MRVRRNIWNLFRIYLVSLDRKVTRNPLLLLHSNVSVNKFFMSDNKFKIVLKAIYEKKFQHNRNLPDTVHCCCERSTSFT